MTKHDAETTPMIDLAQLLVEEVDGYENEDALDIAEQWDRYGLINALQDGDVFKERE